MNLPDLNENVVGYGGGSVIVGIVLRFFYIWWMKTQPSVAQAGANTDLYNLIREEMNMMKNELRLVKRQLACLEMLAREAGIDIQEEYKKRGLLDNNENDHHHKDY